MTKKTYSEPKSRFVQMRGAQAVADVCWAYVNNGKEFFYNTSGHGYAKITMQKGTGNGCDGAAITSVEYIGIDATADVAVLRKEIDAAVALAGGNSAEPFSGSPFVSKVGKDWS